MIDIESKKTLLKQKKHELLVLKKEYADYQKEIISSIQCNNVDKNYLSINSDLNNSFVISYLLDIVSFHAYYKIDNGFSIKSKNNNKFLNTQSFCSLNNHYNSFLELITFFTKEKCNKILNNFNNLDSKIIKIEYDIDNLEDEIHYEKIELAYQEISFGLKHISKVEINNQFDFIKNIKGYYNFRIISLFYDSYKNNFYFKRRDFSAFKDKKIVITDVLNDRIITLKELKKILSTQAKIVHLDNKIIENYKELAFLNKDSKTIKKHFNKDSLIQQLKMINNIKSF